MGAFIKFSADPETGQFRLAPMSSNGRNTTQYAPDLMKDPNNLTYVFDQPQVLEALIRRLSVADKAGHVRATEGMARIRRLRLEIEDSASETESEDEKGSQEESFDHWSKIIQHLPEGHRIRNIELDFNSDSIPGDDTGAFSEPISQALSAKAGRRVSVHCV